MRAMAFVPGLQPLPPFIERQATKILVAVEQNIVKANAGREILEHLRPGRFAVQPLLQICKGRHLTIPHHQQLPIQHAVEIHRRQDFRKAVGNILGRARVQPLALRRRHQLHANAVPFPFGAIGGPVERCGVRLLQWMSEHGRAKDWRAGGVRLLGAARQPVE
jgi:hypothetical protein